MMKIDKIIGLYFALSCFLSSYSIESNKRDRDIFEYNEEKKEHKHHEDESSSKKIKPNPNNITDETCNIKKSKDIAPMVYGNPPIDQRTGLPLTFLYEEKALNDIKEYAKIRDYPSAYIEEELIEPELERINTRNLIVYLYSLPKELINQIFLFALQAIFNDVLKALKSEELDLNSPLELSIFADMELLVKPFGVWERNLPYEKFLSLIRSFPVEKRRELIEDLFIKNNLSKYIKCLLINFFKFDDNIASKYLKHVINSDLSTCQNLRYKLDVFMFARCLAEAGIHPNQNGYIVEDGKRQELVRFDGDKPFCLLEFALCNGNYELAKFFIDAKDGALSQVSKELHCLVNACRNNSIEMVKLLRSEEIDWEDSEHFKRGMIEAISHKLNKVLIHLVKYTISTGFNVEFFQELIDNGLDVNISGQSGSTPLMRAALFGDFNFVKRFVENWGADIHAKNSAGESVLHYCCKRVWGKARARDNKAFEIAQYLIEKETQIGIKDNKGSTLLHAAATSGCLNLLKYFIDNGLDVNARDVEGRTPLMYAVEWAEKEAVNMLINVGADISAKDNHGRTVIWNIINPLREEDPEEEIRDIFNLLVAKGANVFEDIFEDGYDFIDYAIAKGELSLQKAVFLLELCYENESDRLLKLSKYVDEREDIKNYLREKNYL